MACMIGEEGSREMPWLRCTVQAPSYTRPSYGMTPESQSWYDPSTLTESRIVETRVDVVRQLCYAMEY